MAFLTQEQVRKVRLKNAKPYPLERLDKKLLLVEVSGNRSFALREVREAIDPTKPALGQRALFLSMITAACADENGDMLSGEDADQLFDVLTLDEAVALINEVGKSIGVQVGKVKAEGATSSSDSALPSAGPTPIT